MIPLVRKRFKYQTLHATEVIAIKRPFQEIVISFLNIVNRFHMSG